MKKNSILKQLACVGIAVGLMSAMPVMAQDAAAAPADTTKPMPKKHKKHKKAVADSSAMAAAPADTTKAMPKKHKKHKKAAAVDSSAAAPK